MKRSFIFLRLTKKASVLLFCFFMACPAYAEDNNKLELLDSTIEKAMAENHVPVVSLAVVNDNKIVLSKVYALNKHAVVDEESLFQAGTLSHAVTAFAALKLAEQKQFSLDDNINQQLKQWKLPENEYTTTQKVTLRTLLSMTAGVSVPQFSGYLMTEPMPTLLQLLEGKKPAKNPPVRVEKIPGENYAYSSGGTEVIEVFLIDNTGKLFSETMDQLVLFPMGMKNSLYDYYLPVHAIKRRIVAGHTADGKMITGEWLNYPALGSSGLWTTANDLAKFMLKIMAAYHGQLPKLVSQKLAQDMLTPQVNSPYGLGVEVDGKGQTLNFRKSGKNEGYRCFMLAFPELGKGIVVMTNSANGSKVIKAAVTAVSELYGWPEKNSQPSAGSPTKLQSPESRSTTNSNTEKSLPESGSLPPLLDIPETPKEIKDIEEQEQQQESQQAEKKLSWAAVKRIAQAIPETFKNIIYSLSDQMTN